MQEGDLTSRTMTVLKRIFDKLKFSSINRRKNMKGSHQKWMFQNFP